MVDLLRGLRAVVTGSAPRTAAAVALLLAVPQLYFMPKGSTDVAVTTLVALLLLPGILLCLRREPGLALLRTGLFRVLVALLAVRVLAMAWSPDPRAGLALITLLGQFVITLTLMAQAVCQDPDLFRRVQLWYWPWVAAEAGLVLVFRLAPDLEDLFLRHVGGLFIGQNTVAALFGDSPNNVFDVAKSGGVFVNANVAGLFLGVNGLAAFAMASVSRTRWVRLVGLLSLAAVPFTGSKSATILAVVLPAAVFLVRRLGGAVARMPRRRLLIGLSALGVAAVAVAIAGLSFVDALAKSFGDRTAIWGFGARSFLRDPVLGLGYGGWDAGFAAYAREHGIYRSFPPHNVLMATWSNTGLAGLALTVVFLVLLLRLAVRRAARSGPGDRFTAWAAAAMVWTVVHGMGDNTDIFGEIHLIPIFSLLIAYLIGRVGEEPVEHAEPHRRDRETPAVPAVGDVHREPGAGAAQLPPPVRGAGSDSEHAAGRLG